MRMILWHLDYSKWHNIDTDSEPEMLSQQALAPKATPLRCYLLQPPHTRLRPLRRQRTAIQAPSKPLLSGARPRKSNLRLGAPLQSQQIMPFSRRSFLPSQGLIEVPLALYRDSVLE